MWFWLFVACVVVLFLSSFVFRLQKRWGRMLSHFVFTQIANTVAYCSVSDFKRAERNGSRTADGRFVIVPETLTFHSAWSSPVPERLRSADSLVNACFSFQSREEELFVPFVSEKYLPYSRQEALFVPPSVDLHAFIASKKRENERDDPRLLFLRLMGGTGGLITAAVWFIAFCGVVTGAVSTAFTFVERIDKERRNAPAVFHTTTAGSSEVTEYRGTQEEIWNLPVTNPWTLPLVLLTGKVASSMAIGGGLEYVCLQKIDDSQICGFAAPGLKIGDTAYLRREMGKQRNSGQNSSLEFIRWTITKEEAYALLEKGYRLER